MIKTTFALCLAIFLSTSLTTGCGLVSFTYTVTSAPTQEYLATHCVSSNNCSTLTSTVK